MKKLIVGIMVLLGMCAVNSSAVQKTKEVSVSDYKADIEFISKNDMYQRLHTLNNQPQIQWLNVIATAYTASADECGNDKGITASGRKVSLSRGTIAAPYDIPFYTEIAIPELDKTFIVEDRGSQQHIRRIDENTIRIDVYMKTKAEAKQFGVKKLKGYIVKQ